MEQDMELQINGYSIYIDQLDQLDKDYIVHDAGNNKVLNWTTHQIKQAIQPAICILDSLRNAAKDQAPNELELSMQFKLSLKGETPVFKIVSAESSAEISVKFIWKNDT